MDVIKFSFKDEIIYGFGLWLIDFLDKEKVCTLVSQLS